MEPHPHRRIRTAALAAAAAAIATPGAMVAAPAAAHAGVLSAASPPVVQAMAPTPARGAPPPALAQDTPPPARQVDVGLAGGLFFSSDWSDLVVLGVDAGIGGFFEQVLLRDVAVSPGGMADLSVTYWRGRYGVRGHVAFSRSCLSVGPGCADVLRPGERAALELTGPRPDVDTWLYDVAGVVALREAARRRRFLPYAFAGVGGITYDPDPAMRRLLPSFVVFGDSPGRLVLRDDLDDDDLRDVDFVLGDDIILDDDDDGSFLISADEIGFETRLAGHLGLGAKLRLPVADGGLALHVEAADHIVRSPLEARVVFLRRDFDLDRFGLETDDELEAIDFDFGLVHNLRLVAGITLEVPLPSRTRDGTPRAERMGGGT